MLFILLILAFVVTCVALAWGLWQDNNWPREQHPSYFSSRGGARNHDLD